MQTARDPIFWGVLFPSLDPMRKRSKIYVESTKSARANAEKILAKGGFLWYNTKAFDAKNTRTRFGGLVPERVFRL